jgi:hypothetical protein
LKNTKKVKVWPGPDQIAHAQILDGIKVRYNKKKYSAGELLEAMAARIEELEDNQCKPGAACIFMAEEEIYHRCIEQMEKTTDAAVAAEGFLRGMAGVDDDEHK